MKTFKLKNSLIMLAIAVGTFTPISYSKVRGNLYDYDEGAPKSSKWPDLFAETPNYRAFGKAVLGGRGEKFRWKMGPMWYRGRLTPNSVKVFIVGQEGAQDENVTNRSFTGSTGTRMQKFLNYLGINKSYLFMNTFVYTINGQYGLYGDDANDPEKVKQLEKLLWLAQNEDSIVVSHRHKLFNYMLETNRRSLSLVIGVGTAGKDSVATWFKSHGENCSSSKLTYSACEGRGNLKGIIGIAVRHPGAASARNGGEGAVGGLVRDFQNKARIVAKYIENNPNFLPKDSGAQRNFSKNFRYGYASIPHRDFAFGTNWRMGQRGTSSNRRGSHTVQVFSSAGCYNNTLVVNGRCSQDETHRIKYDDPKAIVNSAPYEMQPEDVPYESPKSRADRRSYDEGPKSFSKNLINFGTIDYKSLGVTQHESFGPNGIYRGRLNKAKLLIIADQVSHTDFFSGRALTGAAGQRLQNFIEKLGATDSYAILRTLPVDTLDLSLNKVKQIALNREVVSKRNLIIDQVMKESKTTAVIAVGPIANEVVKRLKLAENIKTYSSNIAFPGNGHKEQFNSILRSIKNNKIKFDKSPSRESYDETLRIIPRKDLPAYTRWWMGTTGDLAARAYEIVNGQRVDNGNYYKLYAPYWATRWKANPSDLNSEEMSSVRKFKTYFSK